MAPHAESSLDGVADNVRVPPAERLVTLAQSDEPIVRLDLHHVDPLGQFHRKPVDASEHHRTGRHDPVRHRLRCPGRDHKITLNVALQAGWQGAHALHGVVPSGPAGHRLEHIGRPHPTHEGIDGCGRHRLDHLVQLVAALAGQHSGLQVEQGALDLAAEAQGLSDLLGRDHLVVNLHLLPDVLGRVHRPRVQQQAEIGEASRGLLALDAYQAGEQVRGIHPIEQEQYAPSDREGRRDNGRLRVGARDRSVQLNGIELGAIQFHQTSRAVNVQLQGYWACCIASTGGRQRTMKLGIQETR
ncbi:hypothetical protein FQZ97_703300 [compost metagenome]